MLLTIQKPICSIAWPGQRTVIVANGWWPDRALENYKTTGVCDEACYPYTAGDQNCTGRCADWQNRVTKITSYQNLTNIAAIKEWLSTNGPMVACFSVYSDFFAYNNGVYRKTAGATLQWRSLRMLCRL